MTPQSILCCSEVADARLPHPPPDLESGRFYLLQGTESLAQLNWRILSLREEPTAGGVRLPGLPQTSLAERVEYRNRHFVFLHAMPCLLPSLTVVENIAMPFLHRSDGDSVEAARRTRRLLDFIHWGDESLEERGDALSAFDQHRVALTRALITEPVALFVGEGFAGLNSSEERVISRMLGRVVRKLGCTVVACGVSDGLQTEADWICNVDTGEKKATAAST